MPDNRLFSFHGGHSGPACSHADDTLFEIVEAAICNDMQAFGVTEHMPKPSDEFLDECDLVAGLTASDTFEAFRVLAEETFPAVVEKYGSQIEIFWGFETDVTPQDSYVERIHATVERFKPCYLVGSVHHVADTLIDDIADSFNDMVRAMGGLEAVQLEYFRLQADLIDIFRPMIVSHFDLIRVHQPLVRSEPVRRAIRQNLERIADYSLLMEFNSSPPRDCPGAEPFPSLDLAKEALRVGVRATLGDDSHSAAQVSGGLSDCVALAREAGYRELHGLTHTSSGGIDTKVRMSL